MRGFGSDQKIGVEVYHRVCSAGAIHAYRDSGVRSFAQIAIHAQRHLHVGFFGEKDLSHRNGLKRLLRDLSQYGGGIEANFCALGGRITRHRRQAIVAQHVVHR